MDASMDRGQVCEAAWFGHARTPASGASWSELQHAASGTLVSSSFNCVVADGALSRHIEPASSHGR
jgi:hypothetical protein